MALTLDAYLETVSAEPMVWGETDCMFLAARWLAGCSGHDVAEPYRGRYSTEKGAARVMCREGGAVALLGKLALSAGWCARVPATALRGNVGIVIVETPDGKQMPAASICVGRARWATLTPPLGIYVAPAQPVAVWGPL